MPMKLFYVVLLALFTHVPRSLQFAVEVWVGKPRFIVIGMPAIFQLNCSAIGSSKIFWKRSEDNTTNPLGWNSGGDQVNIATLSATIDVRGNNEFLAGTYRCTAEISSEYVVSEPLVVVPPRLQKVRMLNDETTSSFTVHEPLIFQCHSVNYTATRFPVYSAFYKWTMCPKNRGVESQADGDADCASISLGDADGRIYIMTIDDAANNLTAASSIMTHCRVKVHYTKNVLLASMLRYSPELYKTNRRQDDCFDKAGQTVALEGLNSTIVCTYAPRYHNISLLTLFRRPPLKVAHDSISNDVRVRLLQISPDYSGEWACAYGGRSNGEYVSYLSINQPVTRTEQLMDTFKYIGESVRYECQVDQVYPRVDLRIHASDTRGYRYSLTGKLQVGPENVLLIRNLTRREVIVVACTGGGNKYGSAVLQVLEIPLVTLKGGEQENYTVIMDSSSSEVQTIQFSCNYTIDIGASSAVLSWVLPVRPWPAVSGDNDMEYGVVDVTFNETSKGSELTIAVTRENFADVAGFYRCRVEYPVSQMFMQNDIVLSNAGRVTTILVTGASFWYKFTTEWWWWLALVGGAAVVVIIVVAVVKAYPARRRLSLAETDRLVADLTALNAKTPIASLDKSQTANATAGVDESGKAGLATAAAATAPQGLRTGASKGDATPQKTRDENSSEGNTASAMTSREISASSSPDFSDATAGGRGFPMSALTSDAASTNKTLPTELSSQRRPRSNTSRRSSGSRRRSLISR